MLTHIQRNLGQEEFFPIISSFLWECSFDQLNIFQEPVCGRDICIQCLSWHYSPQPRNGNNLKCPSTDVWIKKTWCIYTREHYSAIKRDELLTFLIRWVEQRLLTLNEISKTQRAKHYVISPTQGVKTKNRMVVTRD